MAFEQKDMSGALFKNDKQGNEKAPDYKGDATINGQKVFIAAWIRESKSGQKFMSLSFEEPRQKQESRKNGPHTRQDSRGDAERDAFDDAPPF